LILTAFKVVLAGGATYLMIRVGIAFLRGFARPMDEPPPAGELRRVRLRYRCPVCGMEIRIESAADEDPLPPRHCMDEMDLVARLDD
jgi:hypothetical protein